MIANNPTGENGRKKINMVVSADVNKYWEEFFDGPQFSFTDLEANEKSELFIGKPVAVTMRTIDVGKSSEDVER